MPSVGKPDPSRWFGPALGIVAAITAARLVALWFSGMDLFVDESQYWLWGQDIALGYFSKPPLIAWVIRAVTDLAGSDAAFWVRAPAPVFHAATALILGAIAAERFGRKAGIAVAAGFVTLPVVAVGSLLMSTDTIMFPFLAAALWVWLRVVGDAVARPGLAFAAGALVGVAFLAKYAAIYFVIFAALAALSPAARPRWPEALAALAGFALLIAPNLVWNLLNGAPTLSHTVDNTQLARGVALHPAAMLEFVLAQFLVFGPVLFAALLVLAIRRTESAGPGGLFLWLSLPVVGVVVVQALLSGKANANWAAAACLAGTLVTVPFLLSRARRWLMLSFAVNGALCLFLAVAATQATTLRLGADRPLLSRYLGLDQLSQDILATARDQGAGTIVAAERAVLAGLFHAGRDGAVPIRAWPHEGPPAHHYQMRFSLGAGDPGPLLAVTRAAGQVPPCTPLWEGVLPTSDASAWNGDVFRLWLLPATCWAAP